MTAAAFHPARPRRSFIGKLGSAVAARARARGKPGKLAAAFAVAREHIVTAAALTAVDIGAFHGCQVAGWIVTGVSLLALDFAVRG